MPTRLLTLACLLAVMPLAACGSKSKSVNTASYTCDQFKKSLATKGDDSAGNFVNQMVKKAGLKHTAKENRNEVSFGIYFACRKGPGSLTPATRTLLYVHQIEAGKFHFPGPPPKKKSGK